MQAVHGPRRVPRGRSLDDDGEAYTERTAFAELHAEDADQGRRPRVAPAAHRPPVARREDPELSNRWRHRLQAEKELTKGRTSIVPYVNVEPYYDSRYDTVNRVRLIRARRVVVVAALGGRGQPG